MSKRKKRAASARIVPELKHVDSERVPIIVPSNVPNQRLRFRFDMLDFQNYCLHTIRSEQLKHLLKRLQHFEHMTVQDARNNHDISEYPMVELRAKNRSAWEKLRRILPEGSDVCKIVIEKSGAARLFGLRDDNVIHIIWYDAHHEIWPENKQVR